MTRHEKCARCIEQFCLCDDMKKDERPMKIRPTKHDDIGAFDRSYIVGGKPYPVTFFQFSSSTPARAGSDHGIGGDQPLANEPGDHGLGHHAGADGRDGRSFQW